VGTGTEVVVTLAELTVDTETVARCFLEEMMREASFKLFFLVNSMTLGKADF